jgi:purine-nucleoside phosphorylase
MTHRIIDSPEMVQAAATLNHRIDSRGVDVFVVAGSGFREALPELHDTIQFSMQAIPHFPAPAVAGHGADLIHGSLHGRKILIATGRVHLYEGYSPDDVVFATRLACKIGCQKIILTNASGSVDPGYPAGSLVILKDHMNLTGKNCEAITPGVPAHFTDMTDPYDVDWSARIITAIKSEVKPLAGIYAGLVGPSYETTAEARMLAILGANIVGMSTVQECIAARTLGMKVLGLSLVTNMAGGLGGPVNHAEVLAAGKAKTAAIRTALSAAIEHS